MKWEEVAPQLKDTQDGRFRLARRESWPEADRWIRSFRVRWYNRIVCTDGRGRIMTRPGTESPYSPRAWSGKPEDRYADDWIVKALPLHTDFH